MHLQIVVKLCTAFLPLPYWGNHVGRSLVVLPYNLPLNFSKGSVISTVQYTFFFVSLLSSRISSLPRAFVCELSLLFPQTKCHLNKCLHSIYRENYVLVMVKHFSGLKMYCLPRAQICVLFFQLSLMEYPPRKIPYYCVKNYYHTNKHISLCWQQQMLLSYVSVHKERILASISTVYVLLLSTA